MTEIKTYIILLVIPYFLFLTAFLLNQKNTINWKIRKFIHTAGLFIGALYGTFLDTIFDLIILVVILLVTLIIFSVPPLKIIQRLIIMGTREGEKEIIVFVNVCLTTLNVILLRLLFVENRWIFMAAVLSVSFGDGLGEFIGRPYGKHKYKVFSKKSLEGSLGVFFGSVVGGILSAILFINITLFIVFIIISASLTVTFIEAISYLFLDNLIMPLVYAGFLWYFLI